MNVLANFTNYGRDVEKAKQIAQALGISESCIWFPKMYRKDLMVGIALSDLCFGQFGISWISNGTIFEALASGKLVMPYRDLDQFCNHKDLYPIHNANSPEEVATCLDNYVSDPVGGREMGSNGLPWHTEQSVNKTIYRYCQYIDKRARELNLANK